jgi:hemerythrin-like domain-containing protein
MGAITRDQSPLADLWAFHQRMLDQCEALWRLVIYLGQCAPDAQSKLASEQLLAWFDRAGDAFRNEEEFLYPALVGSLAHEDAEEVREMTATLARRHRALDALWSRLRLTVASVAAGECRPEVIEAAGEFIRLVRRQVENEQDSVLPLAQELIQEPDLSRIAEAVCARAPVADSRPAAAT